MALIKRGNTFWYEFIFAGTRIRESTKTDNKTLAKKAEEARRRQLEEGFNGVTNSKAERVRKISDLATEYLEDYTQRNQKSATFATYAIGHVCRHLGSAIIVQITKRSIADYQTTRLKEGAAPKSVNEEVGFLLRLMGNEGVLLRAELKREKKLSLKLPPSPGKAFEIHEVDALHADAKKSRSVHIETVLAIALNTTMRDGEIKGLQWKQIDFAKHIITVGEGKTEESTGRTIPMNEELQAALLAHAQRYATKFGQLRPDWYLFPFGRRGRMDPTKPVTTLKTAWQNIKARTGVEGRFHDTRHTVITELAESGAGDETIMSIAGHVSRRMLSRYSHIRTQAKRNALDAVMQERAARRELARTRQHAAHGGAVN